MSSDNSIGILEFSEEERHEYTAWLLGVCLYCDQPKDHPIHVKENEQ